MAFTLSALATQALGWTKEHVLPWMLNNGPGLIARIRRRSFEKQQEALLLLTAAGLPANAAMRMHLVCDPGGKHGLFIRDGKAKMCFVLHIMSVAPFGVRPHSISLKFLIRRADDQNAGTTRAKLVTIDDKKILHDFMGPGDSFPFEVDRDVEFKELPPAGTTMVLWAEAKLTMLGPWAEEYRLASFNGDIFVDCRHAL